jgi:hypothetical protein
MASIEFVNMREVMAGVTRSLKSIQDAQKKAATQMGITAKQAMQAEVPPHIKTGAWQKSIGYQVSEISDLKTELVVGSNGAERYYSIQEALHHPIEIGWHSVQPELANIYQKVITQGLLGKSIVGSITGSTGMSDTGGFDQFGAMAGF